MGATGYTYEQWRKVSEAVADAMEYAHDRAVEHPDKADPLWNLDEYVNRVMEAAFGAGRGTCEMRHGGDDYGRFWYTCGSCGRRVPTTDDSDRRTVRDVPERCPGCGRKVE